MGLFVWRKSRAVQKSADAPGKNIRKGKRKSMGVIEIVLMGVGLAMDAFAVAVCKGLAMRKVNMRQCFLIALFFGGFQGLMPLLGWLLGRHFADSISAGNCMKRF